MTPDPIILAQGHITPQAAIERLFTAEKIESAWFTDSFLSQIPVTPEQVIQEIQNTLGAFRNVQPEGDAYRVTLERGTMTARIALDANGQITGLLFQNMQTNMTALTDAIEQLNALPGQVNLLVTEINAESSSDLVALNADQPLAVGSTFKLAVLAALQQEIEAGQRSWADVIDLQPQDKSLPSGLLQNWFDGALLTVQTLATLMISQSDNTATDTLIHLLGREAIEPFAPHNRPFLTTREAFTLKASANASQLQQYRQGNETQRRQLLAELLEAPLPNVAEFEEGPVALDIEWFFTPRELCTLMGQVADLPLMSVNPGGGLVNPADWSRVAFKGGSEPGVLNLTTELVTQQGKRYCVSATWNNPDAPVDESRFFSIYSGIAAKLLQNADR